MRYTASFLVTTVALLGATFFITGIAMSPYPEPVDFRKLTGDEFIVTNRLSQRYRNDLKFRHIMKFGAPRAAVFGNHAIRRMRAKDLGASPGTDGFMNLYADHIGIPEVRDTLLYLEAKDRLPKELILVALHNPHTSSGYQIAQYIWELPLDLYLLYGDFRLTNRLRYTWGLLAAEVKDRLDWRNLLYELFSGPIFGCIPSYGTARLSETPADGSGTTLKKPSIVDGFVRLFDQRERGDSCFKLQGYYHDGSYADHKDITEPANLKRQVGPWSTQQPPAGFEFELPALLRQIHEIGERNGRKVAFFVPPAFEGDRSSPRYVTLSNAIRAVEGKVTVLDHRRKYREKSFFQDYMHPNSLYFERLAEKLRTLGLL